MIIREQPDFRSGDDYYSQHLVGPEHGYCEKGPHWTYLRHAISELGIGPDVLDLDGAPLKSGAPRTAPASRLDGICFNERFKGGRNIVGSHAAQKPPIKAENKGMFSLAQFDCILG